MLKITKRGVFFYLLACSRDIFSVYAGKGYGNKIWHAYVCDSRSDRVCSQACSINRLKSANYLPLGANFFLFVAGQRNVGYPSPIITRHRRTWILKSLLKGQQLYKLHIDMRYITIDDMKMTYVVSFRWLTLSYIFSYDNCEIYRNKHY